MREQTLLQTSTRYSLNRWFHIIKWL
jgi:hypothetical protein